jgi:phosphatidylglycerophosphate synthase
VPEKHDPGFLTVSNLLSLSRIPLGVMFLVTNDPKALAIIVVAGSLTDLLDGVIARVSRTTSEVGILLDPFCDKIFVLLGVVSFLPSGRLDWAGFVILILRDIFTGGSYLVSRLVGRDMHPRSRMPGKVTTFFQFLTVSHQAGAALAARKGVTTTTKWLSWGLLHRRDQAGHTGRAGAS